MKNERTYCLSCNSTQRTIRDRSGLRCSVCERLLAPTQGRRKHRPMNVTHNRVKEFADALRESLDRQPIQDTRHPLKCQCATCGSPAVIYPRPEPHGVCVCPKCSPAWLASFALFATNQFRQQHGLEAVTA